MPPPLPQPTPPSCLPSGCQAFFFPRGRTPFVSSSILSSKMCWLRVFCRDQRDLSLNPYSAIYASCLTLDRLLGPFELHLNNNGSFLEIASRIK
jgi:hypothetical protein